MDTIGNIIERALTISGQINPTQGMDDKQRMSGLSALNSMLAMWVSDGIPIFHDILINFNTVPNQVSYLMSADPTANPDILTVLPVTKVVKVWFRLDQTDYPVKIISFADYDDIPDKSWVSGYFPEKIYFEQNLTDVNKGMTIYMYPITSTVIEAFFRVVYSYEDVPNANTDVFNMFVPSEFVQAYVYNLAIEMANNTPGMVLDQKVLGMAGASKSKLYRLVPVKDSPKINLPGGRRRRW